MFLTGEFSSLGTLPTIQLCTWKILIMLDAVSHVCNPKFLGRGNRKFIV
jgi:hypothetical protein